MSRKQKSKKTNSAKNRFLSEVRLSTAEARFRCIEEVICSIPKGRVATYGQIAEAAGCLRGHRLVARFLSSMELSDIPWQRVVGADGGLKTPGRLATKQRLLLKREGVRLEGKRIDLGTYGHTF